MSGSFFPVIVGVVVFFIVFLAINKFVVERFYGWNSRGTPVNVALGLSTLIAFGVIWYMS